LKYFILKLSKQVQKLPKTVNFISSTLVPAEHAVSIKQISLASVFNGIHPVIQTKIHPPFVQYEINAPLFRMMRVNFSEIAALSPR
jgi:hypothetical protein